MSRIPMCPTLEKNPESLEEKLERSTADIGLSVRTTNCLENAGIFTVRDLLHCKPQQLLKINNFGPRALKEVYRALEPLGFVRTNA